MLKSVSERIGRHKVVFTLGLVASVALGAALTRHIAAQGAIGSDHTATATAMPIQPNKTAGSVVGKVDAVDATDNPCTTSTAFADMPGMTRSFTQAGPIGGTSKAVVMFQGEWIPNTGRALLRLVVDGLVVSGPGDSASPFAATEGTDDRTAGFNFITATLSQQASHTATIQWASNDGSSICVDERSMVILHR